MEAELNPALEAAPEGPSPWVSLGPSHLLFWGALLWPLVAYAVIFPALIRMAAFREPLAWTLSGVSWALGGAVAYFGFQSWAAESPSVLRRVAFLGALGLWGLQVAIRLAMNLHQIAGREAFRLFWMWEPWAALMLAALPALLMLVSGGESRGGAGDAATFAMAQMAGLGSLGPVFLGAAALFGHPLAAGCWEALRRPGDALAGEWFEGGDPGGRAANLGPMALTFVLAAPAVLLLVFLEHNRFAFLPSSPAFQAPAAGFAALLLGLAGLVQSRRSGRKEGRGLAIAALVLGGLLLLPVLAAVVILMMLSTRMLH